jgi:predicted ATPase/class 3 adenylate cyclase
MSTVHTVRTTTFADLLRRHRRSAGLTQEELAEAAGLSVRAVSDLERGLRRSPHKDTVGMLADALHLTDPERTAFEATARRVLGPPGPQPEPRTTQPPGGEEAAPIAAAEPIQGEHAAQRASLPTGTVTFLFTDIEGSTRLLQRLGARYSEVLDGQRMILRAAFAAHGGSEVDTQGDSFFASFPTAHDALAAAAQAQRELAAYAWPDGTEVRGRMGLQSGAPALAGERYVGLDVHRAARIGAAGYGGQVLLSAAVMELARDELPEGTALRDVGVHRLKDLQRRERLYQLVLPDLLAEFPPLKTLDAHPNNLSVQPTPFVGRERELADVAALLRREDARLVTLTGVAGTGKTRLAVQVAAELSDVFADGAWFVRLSRLVDPTLVMSTIAQTLGLHEAGGRPVDELLATYLHEKQALLVLDNFEQVVTAATAVAALLETCAGLTVLATSRVRLRLRAEKQYEVQPLPLPNLAHLPPSEQVTQYAAVALFMQRAEDAQPDFAVTNATAPAIAAICARLDGLPLAIELAAAKVRILPLPALLARLERQLPVLVGGARDLEARQQTMRNTLAWSYGLLSAEEQRLFRRLAVFVGGATLEAVEAVCVAPEGAEPLGLDVLEGLTALVEQSLLQQRTVSAEAAAGTGGTPGEDGAEGEAGERGEEQEDSAGRFGMLHVIREYALEQLEASGEAEALRRAHAAYFVALAEQSTSRQVIGLQGAQGMARLEREQDNFRAALTWACAREEVELGLRLGAALSGFWVYRGSVREGRAWLEALLVLAPEDEHLRLYEQLGDCAVSGDAALEGYQQALELWRDRDRPDPLTGARLLRKLLTVYWGFFGTYSVSPSPEELAALHAEALGLAEQAADEDELWRVRIAPTNALIEVGSREDLERNRDLCVAAAAYFERRKEWPALYAALDGVAGYALRLGNYEESRAASRRCLEWPQLPAWARGNVQFMIGHSYWVEGESDACIATAQQALAQLRPGDPLAPLDDVVGLAANAAYCCGRWSELDTLQPTLALIWDELQEVPGMQAPWVREGYMAILLVALAREDRAAADAAAAQLDRIVPPSHPDAPWRRSMVAAHLADDPTRFDLDDLARRPGDGVWVLLYFAEHGLPAPGWLIQRHREYRADVATALANTAEALASGDDVRLAAAIDAAEGRHLLPHAARMRIVLA